jgi:hypothetical protein
VNSFVASFATVVAGIILDVVTIGVIRACVAFTIDCPIAATNLMVVSTGTRPDADMWSSTGACPEKDV